MRHQAADPLATLSLLPPRPRALHALSRLALEQLDLLARIERLAVAADEIGLVIERIALAGRVPRDMKKAVPTRLARRRVALQSAVEDWPRAPFAVAAVASSRQQAIGCLSSCAVGRDTLPQTLRRDSRETRDVGSPGD